MTDRSKAPKAVIPTEIPFINPEKILLDNGLPVYFLEGGTEEIVKVEVLFYAGSFYQEKPLVTYSVANLLKSGTVKRDAAEVSRVLDHYGVYLQVDAQKDIASLTVFVLQKHLEPVLDLFHEMLKEPSFPEEELEILLKNQQHQHQVNVRKVQYLSRIHFAELLFGSAHPYGYRLKEEDFDKVGRQDLLDFHREYFKLSNAICIVSGRFPANMPSLLNKYLNGKPDRSRPGLTPDREKLLKTSGPAKHIVEKPDALQSAVRIGKRIIPRTHPDFNRLMITNALLGGFFGSRLMRNIRQEKGYTYGINSALVSLLHDGYFFISTQVGVDVCQKAIDEIYHELKNLRNVPAGNAELQTLKKYLAGNYLRSFDGPFAQSDRFKEMLVFGMDFSHYQAFLEELKNIHPETIMQTAEKYLHEDSMTELVVGKK